MAYVPPHLRNRQNEAAQADSNPRSLEALQKSLKRTTISSEPTYTLDDISDLLECHKGQLNTLTIAKAHAIGSSETPEPSRDEDSLRAIILFEGQHPEWQSDHRILCKSNLHVLRKRVGNSDVHDDDKPSESPLIHGLDVEYPLFQEIPFMKKKFEFGGWWRIQNITLLAPRSAELVALFDKKFNTGNQNGRGHNIPFSMQRGRPKTRTTEAWNDSLSREWAVVTLVRNHARKDPPEVPAMQRPTNGEVRTEKSPAGEEQRANSTDHATDA